jgi:hypothetical protein
MWRHASCRRSGGIGDKSPYCRWSMGNATSPIRAVRAERHGWGRPWRQSARRLTPRRSPHGWLRKSWRMGQHGRPSGSTSFSVLRRRSKGATALCPKCSTSSGGCPSSARRCGPSCITSIGALRMAQLRQLVWSAGRFQTSLQRLYPTAMPCLGLGNAIVQACEVADVIHCPALSGYPHNCARSDSLGFSGC